MKSRHDIQHHIVKGEIDFPSSRNHCLHLDNSSIADLQIECCRKTKVATLKWLADTTKIGL